MPYKDPEIKKAKHKEYSRRYYEANKEEIRAKGRIYKKQRYQTLKDNEEFKQQRKEYNKLYYQQKKAEMAILKEHVLELQNKVQ